MKTAFWVVLLGIVIFFMYMRVRDYGFPWEDQVVLSDYEANKRYRGGGEQLYVFGEVANRTRKPVTAEVECKTLPPGMTLTPKATKMLKLNPNESVAFDMELRSRRNATGAECAIRKWSAGGGLEERVMQGAQRIYQAIRAGF